MACFRYEIAIPLPKSDRDGLTLLCLALIINTSFSLIIGVIVWLFRSQIQDFADHSSLTRYLWVVPLGVWLTGTYVALQYWATRKQQFGLIARTRVSRVVGGSSAQIVLAISGMGGFGLIVGQLFNFGFGIVGIIRTLRLEKHRMRVLMARIVKVGGRYIRFPLYSAPEAFANNASLQIPIILIAAWGVNSEAGHLMLASQAMAIPMALLGAAISQVYLAQAPEELRRGKLATFTVNVIARIVRIAVGPLLLIAIVSPTYFPLVFGQEWTRSGEMVQWMVPWFVLQIVVSPVSMILHVTNNQRIALVLQLNGVMMRIGSVMLAYWLIKGKMVEAYALSSALFYVAYACVILRVGKIRLKELVGSLKGAIWPLLSSIVLGSVLVSIGARFLN